MAKLVNETQAAAYLAANEDLRGRLHVGPEAVLRPSALGDGEHNVNYSFATPDGSRWVLRINVLPQPFHENQVLYEYNALEAVAQSGRTPKPLYVDYSSDALGKGVLVEGFCPGRPLDYDHILPGDLDQAAAILADVHGVAPADDAPLHRPADPMGELYGECVERYRVYRASAFEDAGISQWVEMFLKRTQEAMDAVGQGLVERRVVNTEPLPSHFLLTPSGDGSFVDWERPILGDVVQDLAFFVSPAVSYWDSEHLFTVEEEGEFLAAYSRYVQGRFSLAGLGRRLPAWRMLTALRAVTWCCKNLIRYNQSQGSHTTEKTRRKLPVYLTEDFLAHLADTAFRR